MYKSITRALLLSCMVGMIPVSGVYAASAVPQPGDSLGTVEEKSDTPKLDNKLDNKKSENQSLRFTLKAINVDQPETHFDQEALQKITAKAVGHEITVKDLDAVLWDLAVYARTHGFPAAYAYVPEQKAKGGELLMRIALGRYDNIKVENNCAASYEDIAKGLLASLKSGDVIKERSLESSLFNVNEIYGVKANGTLVPGSKDGTSDLIVHIEPGKTKTATVYTDNYGSKSSGRYRYGFQADLMGVIARNSRMTIGGLISNNNLHNYNIGWETRGGHMGTTLGARFSRMDYELGSLFSALGAKGIANTTSLYGMTPIWRTTSSNLIIKYGIDYRSINDEMRSAGLNVKKHSHSFNLGIDGVWREKGGLAVHYALTGYMGNVSSDSLSGDVIGKAGNTLGSFSKGILDITALQPLGHSCNLLWKFQGQKASRNLDSSEKMFLGGARGVRAYGSGEGSGDEGYLSSLEFQYRTPWKGLVLRAYYDVGHVKVVEDGRYGGQTLKGWGIGMTYQHPDHYFLRLDYARRVGLVADAGDDAKSPQRIWFLAGKTW
ncbi:MAG: ShlB/FhaC/HecB family hemolysin secretion/activation protein [Anaerovibrio sp.]|uniref:ShlB/FhaC/HecB family hemolysin secretion/activation protein n=1 Tax=Anaerovibrio sp. TaxID=1872532 RepID=UPI0025F727DA|nr:ShlB/FhaC/HecB family hemolysin secretion/activation protein [Anaerovibrio sp.]MCR5175864.1 ShlB/FhaC/HecB family hemolysin secretion/activation protein [Anaerovibrio sp.]